MNSVTLQLFNHILLLTHEVSELPQIHNRVALTCSDTADAHCGMWQESKQEIFLLILTV